MQQRQFPGTLPLSLGAVAFHVSTHASAMPDGGVSFHYGSESGFQTECFILRAGVMSSSVFGMRPVHLYSELGTLSSHDTTTGKFRRREYYTPVENWLPLSAR